MKHARLETADGSRIVRADGTEPQPWDTASPVLHLLPQLHVSRDVIAVCPSPRIRCTATLLSPAARWPMPHELVVRQPLPNRCFMVAGTPDSRYGFLVPLPPELPDTVVVRFEWRFTDAGQIDALRRLGDGTTTTVDHTLRLRLRPGGHGQVFSTDTAAWPVDDGAEAPFRRQPFAVLSADGLPAAREGNASVRMDARSDVLTLDEQVDVPGILLSDIWGFAEFEAECLHEVRQTTVFDPASPGTLAHRANACVGIPAEVLVQAVRFARDVPYGPGTPYAGSMAACERHPALRTLCGWWNSNAPDPQHRRAGLCSVELRVRDDGEYWNACHETPNMPVDNPVKTPEIAARVGDVVLVAFHQGQHAATFPEAGGCALHDVAGHPWQTVGVTEAEVRCGEVDEGWHVLSGLAALPDRFPAAWDWLTGNALRGYKQPADGPSVECRATPLSPGRRPRRDPGARAGLSRMLARLRARMTRTRG